MLYSYEQFDRHDFTCFACGQKISLTTDPGEYCFSLRLEPQLVRSTGMATIASLVEIINGFFRYVDAMVPSYCYFVRVATEWPDRGTELCANCLNKHLLALKAILPQETPPSAENHL